MHSFSCEHGTRFIRLWPKMSNSTLGERHLPVVEIVNA